MSQYSKLPLFPGNHFPDVGKNNFQRPQIWTHYRGIPALSDRRRQDTVEMIALYPPKMAQNLTPGWLQYDKRVLCFDAFFREGVADASAYQIRSMRISFFLEDGTVQVIEPKIADSGIPQGCIVKRQKVPAGDLHERKFLSVLDFNVGKPVTIFSRTYHVTNCDDFTRQFLNQLGIRVPQAESIPVDPNTEMRKAQANVTVRRFGVKSNKLAQFLQNDGKVLRYSGFWDSREKDMGYVRDLTVLFYLCDNTLEIIEVLPANSGRQETLQFLKRMKLPKKASAVTDLDLRNPMTVLNVFGMGLTNGRFIPDSKAEEADKNEFVTEKDLQVGKTLDVFGRSVVLIDCDAFTRNFYKEKYGLEGITPLEKAQDPDQTSVVLKPKERQLPAFNGWGTHQDSEENCKTLEPKPPKTDVKKFISHENQVLRFGAKLISRIKENSERIFIVNYYLADDTISVFEKPVRNSGFTGGRFLHRKQFFLPNQNLMSSVRPQIFAPQHFFIGSRIQLSDHVFEIVSADCHVFDYMEKNQNTFPYANIDTIMTKIRDTIRPHYKVFIAEYLPKLAMRENGSLAADFEMMKDMLTHLLNGDVKTHEIITICRYFQSADVEMNMKERGSVVDWNKFIDFIGLEDDLKQDTE
ncbi:EF-hand domain-containing family member C2 [Phlebotomus argentipes]|uniref:EF-hand domain-containing family member C2 n=1 Tax=Phlebotomus argentipes TaxID=94469 RepID=UPI002892DF4D|nr:EF-hand domain-containing family member C2 [Phlebotomus argentipes]